MKAIFFDIDGTLIDFDGSIPASTLDALHQAQAKGHAIFLCSGRSKGMIDPRLLGFGFDGIVASSGAYVEYHNEVLLANYMSEDIVRSLISYMDEHHMAYIFQCTNKIVSTTEGNQRFFVAMGGNPEDENNSVNSLLDSRVSDDALLDHLSQYPDIEKAAYACSDVGVDQVRSDLSPIFDVTAMSFKDAADSAGEITKAGVNKALGIQKVMDHLGITREDVIAFGDGANDYEMIAFAGVGVAMGNASDELKDLADMVTDSVSAHGVYNGMKQLQLL